MVQDVLQIVAKSLGNNEKVWKNHEWFCCMANFEIIAEIYQLLHFT